MNRVPESRDPRRRERPLYGAIVAERRRAGSPVAIADAQIAAICRLHGAALATRDERDFEGTCVRVVNPWR